MMDTDHRDDTMMDMPEEQKSSDEEQPEASQLREMATFVTPQVRRRAFAALLRLLLADGGGR